MDRLIDGYRRFRDTTWPERRRRFEHVADQGQRPRYMVVACSDSRVDPGMIFDAGPGEIFTLRNVANLVPPYQPDGTLHGTSAALEFGVLALQVTDLVVMGHGLCGGIRALLEGVPPGLKDFVGPWISQAASIRDKALACEAVEPQLAGEYEAIRLSLRNLRGFPWIAEREAAGLLRLHGAHFDIRSGELAMLQPDGEFRVV